MTVCPICGCDVLDGAALRDHLRATHPGRARWRDSSFSLSLNRVGEPPRKTVISADYRDKPLFLRRGGVLLLLTTNFKVSIVRLVLAEGNTDE